MERDKRLKEYINSVVRNLTGLAKTYIKITELELKAGLSGAVALIILAAGFILFISFFLLFIGLAGALAFSEAMSVAFYWGLLFMALVYLVFFIILLLCKSKIHIKIDKIIGRAIHQSVKKNRLVN